jgi:hypothetical protein
MKHPTPVGMTLVVSLLLLLALPGTAHAYLDAGTGSYILQLVIAGFVGALFAAKIFWKKIVRFARRLFSRKTSDAPTED